MINNIDEGQIYYPPHFSKFLGNFLHIKVKNPQSHSADKKLGTDTAKGVSTARDLWDTREDAIGLLVRIQHSGMKPGADTERSVSVQRRQ